MDVFRAAGSGLAGLLDDVVVGGLLIACTGINRTPLGVTRPV